MKVVKKYSTTAHPRTTLHHSPDVTPQPIHAHSTPGPTHHHTTPQTSHHSPFTPTSHPAHHHTTHTLTTQHAQHHCCTIPNFYTGKSMQFVHSKRVAYKGYKFSKDTIIDKEHSIPRRIVWNRIDIQRGLLDRLAVQRQMKSEEDWYSVISSQLQEYFATVGLPTLMPAKYHSSPSQLLSATFPEVFWLQWKFTHAPHNYWDSTANQRHYLDWVAERIGVKKWEDWYDVSIEQLSKHYGSGLVSMYGNSRGEMLLHIYPERFWTKFFIYTFVERVRKQREFCDQLAQKLSIDSYIDWYGVTPTDIEWHGGRALFKEKAMSSLLIMRTTCPEYRWSAWRFEAMTNREWKRKQHGKLWERVEREKVMTEIAQKLSIVGWEEWYYVTPQQVVEAGGEQILAGKFRGSLYSMLSTIYPYYPWLEKIKKYLDWLVEDKQLTSPAQLAFYRIPFFFSDLQQNEQSNQHAKRDNVQGDEDAVEEEEEEGEVDEEEEEEGEGDIREEVEQKTQKLPQLEKTKKFRQQREALMVAYPTIPWDSIFVSPQATKTSLHPNSIDRSNGEQHLTTILTSLLPPHTHLFHNYRHPELIHSTGTPMELDVFCPEFHVGFEYQGGEHFHDYYKGALNPQRRRDAEKQRACQKREITLIPVPYWWDCTAESLAGTIHLHRPDITLSTSSLKLPLTPIPDAPPQYQRDRKVALLNPTGVFVRVHTFAEYMDPTDHILTEMYDGCRALWDGKAFVLKGTLHYPQGHKLVPPEWLKRQLPSVFLDGELWYGYGTGEKTKEIINNKVELDDSDWHGIEYVVFDSPDPAIRQQPYLQRLQSIKQLVHNQQQQRQNQPLQQLPLSQHQQPFVRVIEGRVCSGIDELYAELAVVIRRGGEGVVLHDHSAPYLPGFPISWKKNNFHLGLAKVLRIEHDEVRCVNTQGSSFHFPASLVPEVAMERIQHSLQQKQIPVITYKYYGLSLSNQPVLPVFEQAHDFFWHEISPFVIQTQNQKKSSCAVCRTRIRQQQLCVKVDSLYKFKSKACLTVKVTFCLKVKCLSGVYIHRQSNLYTHSYPRFKNKLSLAEQHWNNFNQTKALEEFKLKSQGGVTILKPLIPVLG